EFLPLRGRQCPGCPPAGINLRLPHPTPQRRLREIEFPRHGRHGLAAFSDEPHRLRLELLRERPPLPFGHDTLLPHFRAIRGVHETGAGSSRLCGSRGIRALARGVHHLEGRIVMPSKLIVGCLLLVALVSGCASGPVQHTATSGWFNPSTGVFVFPLADGSLNIELWEVRNYQPFELTNNSADPTLWLTEDRRAVC